MKCKTIRFGEMEVDEKDIIQFPEGILGFEKSKQFCLVDPGDDTFILWLQSLSEPEVAFPLLEPKLFREGYEVKLTASERELLQLTEMREAVVFSIITIPEDVSRMTANLKAPIVINSRAMTGKQAVLNKNEYSVKHSMFRELKAHIATARAALGISSEKAPQQSQTPAHGTVHPSHFLMSAGSSKCSESRV